MRPPVAPPAGLPEVPTVCDPSGAPPVLDVDPEELAVPAELVPGTLDGALPGPLGLLPPPPALAGPAAPSAELAPAEPAPCAPAGDEAAPPAAPPDDALPADPPPAPPPPPACARADTGDNRAPTRSNLDNEMDTETLLSTPTPWSTARSKKMGGKTSAIRRLERITVSGWNRRTQCR